MEPLGKIHAPMWGLGWNDGSPSSKISCAQGITMLTFRRRLPATGAAPGPGAGFARLRVATAVDILFIKVPLPLLKNSLTWLLNPGRMARHGALIGFHCAAGQLHWTL